MAHSQSEGPAVGSRGGQRGDDRPADLSVAVAEPPASLSGAHWANRDNDTLYRRPGRSGTFRRPPAENSFPDDGAAWPEPRVDSFEQHHPPALSGAAPSADGETRTRHWTTIGDGARRPRTSDRDEVNAPEVHDPTPDPGVAMTAWFGGPVDVEVPPDARVSAAGPPADLPVGWPAPGPHGARNPHTRPQPEPTPGVDVGNVLGGPGRDIRPHRAGRRDTPPPGDPHGSRGTAPPADPPARRPGRWVAVFLAVLVLLGGAVAGVVFFTDSADGLKSVLRSAAGPADDKTVTAPLGARSTADFEVVTGTARVKVRSGDLGDDLYRITSAEDSGTSPSPVVDGDRVRLHLTPDGNASGGDVEVTLSSKVRWALRFTGGVDEQLVDLTGGKVSAVDFTGGTRRIELTLPAATGTVGVRVTGAVDELMIKAPQANPVRVRVSSGAKTVAAGERTLRDVAPGSTLTPRNWQAEDRYDVAAAARVTLLSVQNVG